MFIRVKRTMARLMLAVAAVLALSAADVALAAPIDDAKAAGLVGERPDGYLGLVSPSAPAKVKALIDDINAKRRAAYAEIAQKNGTTADKVGALTAEKLYQQAAPGNYLMTPGGQWVQK